MKVYSNKPIRPIRISKVSRKWRTAAIVSMTERLISSPKFRFFGTEPVRCKTIVAGRMVRVVKYPLPIQRGRSTAREDYSKSSGQKSLTSLSRTRQNLVDTIHANLTPFSKFVTLTIRQDSATKDDMSYYLKQFAKRFKRLKGFNLPYVGLLERQERGAFHFHLVVFLDSFIPFEDLNHCWTYGFTDIKAITSDDVIPYIAKYLTKDSNLVKEKGFFNKRIIYRSRGLKTPVEHINKIPDSYNNLESTYQYQYALKTNEERHNDLIIEVLQGNIKKNRRILIIPDDLPF